LKNVPFKSLFGEFQADGRRLIGRNIRFHPMTAKNQPQKSGDYNHVFGLHRVFVGICVLGFPKYQLREPTI
jgi:hypothetical protein